MKQEEIEKVFESKYGWFHKSLEDLICSYDRGFCSLAVNNKTLELKQMQIQLSFCENYKKSFITFNEIESKAIFKLFDFLYRT
jgi:hypothetical protein